MVIGMTAITGCQSTSYESPTGEKLKRVSIGNKTGISALTIEAGENGTLLELFVFYSKLYSVGRLPANSFRKEVLNVRFRHKGADGTERPKPVQVAAGSS